MARSIGLHGRAIGILGAIAAAGAMIGTLAFWGKYDTYSAREDRLFIGEIVEECGYWDTLKWTVKASVKSDPPDCAKDLSNAP